MDIEVELNYRLTGHLKENETVIETLISTEHGIYAATDCRILCLNNDTIGYRLRVHPYESLDRIDCLAEDAGWCIRFSASDDELKVCARTEREARRFAAAVSGRLAGADGRQA